MIGLDTNVLARYLIESGQEVFMLKTVALELEWVLRGSTDSTGIRLGLSLTHC